MQRPYWIMNWAILVCGLAAWVYLQRSESAGARVQAGFSLASLPGVPEASSRAKDERRGAWVNSGLSESLLIDSILTIVQNYYVDESRVDNRELMASTLKSLEEQDLVKLSFRSASEWIVSNGSDRFEVSFSSRYTYDEMMRDSLRLAQFLDKHRKDRLPGGRPVPSGAFLLLNAMLAGLDPHSNLLNPEEYRDLRQGTEGSFGGLGVVVGMQDDVLTVIKPLPKSPAARAGVSKSDRIMQIDSKSTFGTTLDDLVQYMRGEPGTRVNLFVLRDGDLAPRQMSLTREIIQVDSVESRLIPAPKAPIFYAAIDSFSSRTATELREALVRAQKQEKVLSGIILDLRSNPGGLLDQAVKVADLFLEEGRIVSTLGRSREFELAKPNLLRFDYPITILTNGDTASASEIVAGALRDHGRALVIGEPSFGKGSVQTVFELPGEQALKLTIARYYTPKGISIQNVGIIPDIWLQPLQPGKRNVNLLGDYRYKSERFLGHSLDQDKLRGLGGFDPQWKAFYLLPEDADAAHQKDVPLDLASSLLSDLAKREGVPLPKERLRSSYWKASAAKEIHKILRQSHNETAHWMAQTMKVDWTDDMTSARPQDRRLVFDIEIPNRLSLREGQKLLVPWRIRNLSSVVQTQISVFVSGVQGNVGTTEVLVGKVEAGEERRGVVSVDLRVDSKEGPVRLRAGLTRGGWPLMGREHTFWVDLIDSEEPEFETQLRLVQEQGGRIDNVFEAGEQALVELVVKNRSPITAHQVEVNLVNLAGEQIQMDGQRYRLRQLKPGEVKILRFSTKASAQLASSQLQFVVTIHSQEQLLASKQHFFITGEPGQRMSRSDFINTGSGPWKEN